MTVRQPYHWITLVLLFVAASLIAPAAPAQIEDIIVTARKREESLQDVPLSITALSGEQLQERGITDNFELAVFTPNFNTSKTVGRNLDRPVIRGMANASVGGEANASYFLDGVFVSSSISTATTASVERVEVLRGPQSAQFGRATFSGAVSYVTRKPTNEWVGEVNTKAGTDDDYEIGGWFSGPIIEDKLGFLVSAAYLDFGGAWRNNLRAPTDGYDPNNPGLVPADPNAGYAYTAPVPFSDAGFSNLPTGGDTSSMGGEKTKDLMVKLTWTPTDSTESNFKYAYTEGDDEHFPSVVPLPGQEWLNCYRPGIDPGTAADSPAAFCGTFDPTGWENRINLPDFNGLVGGVLTTLPLAARTSEPVEAGTRRESHRFMLDLTQGLGDWELTARAAYNDDSFNQAYDLDHTHVRVLAGLFNFEEKKTEEDYAFELRLATPVESKVRGSVGVYYFNYDKSSQVRSRVGPYVALGAEFECPRLDDNPVCAGPGPHPVTTAFPPATTLNTENIAVFGNVDWDITDQLSLAFETRWADDRKEIVGGNSASDDVSTKAFTPRVTLRYQTSDEFMFYGLVAKGNKPADYNVECYRYDFNRSATETCRQDALALVKEEEQITYEVGFKSAWLDRRLTLNWSGFFIDWENQALFVSRCTTDTIGGTELCSTIRRNAGETEILGMELESNFVLTDNLFVIANYGYQNGEIQKGFDPNWEDLTGNGDIAGKETPNAPQHSGVLGLVVTNQINQDLESFLRADFSYESKRWVQAGNFNNLGERKLTNLRLGVRAENWTLTGYVNNLLNDNTPLSALQFFDFGRTLSNGVNPNLWSLNPQRDRHMGVEFQYRFGAW